MRIMRYTRSKIKSNRHFFFLLQELKKKGSKVQPKLQPTRELRDNDRRDMAVRARVRIELGAEGFRKWCELGVKDYDFLARAYGIV